MLLTTPGVDIGPFVNGIRDQLLTGMGTTLNGVMPVIGAVATFGLVIMVVHMAIKR